MVYTLLGAGFNVHVYGYVHCKYVLINGVNTKTLLNFKYLELLKNLLIELTRIFL